MDCDTIYFTVQMLSSGMVQTRLRRSARWDQLYPSTVCGKPTIIVAHNIQYCGHGRVNVKTYRINLATESIYLCMAWICALDVGYWSGQ